MSTVFDGAARAADDCLSEPNGQAPQGKHWYYRIERGSGRHCWYVRGEDESARAAASDFTATAKTPPRNADLMAPRSIANARAEWPAQQPATSQSDTALVPPRVAPPATGVTGTAPSTTPTQAPASGSWPDPARAMRPLGAPPETTAVAADQQPDVAAVPPPAPVPPPPGLAAMPTDRNTGSLQKLLLVAFGALVLSGLTGSAVYRLAGARRRARMRRDRWPKRKLQRIASNVAMTPWAPPEIENAAPRRDSVHKRAEMDNVRMDDVEMDDVEMDNVRMDNVEMDDIEMDNVRMGSVETDDLEMDDLRTDEVETDAPDDHVERIEDFLARFTRKLEAEMAAPRQQQRRAVS